VKREVAGNGSVDILWQDHNIVFTWKANIDLIQFIEYRTEKQNEDSALQTNTPGK
jgi:hypothetical protein